MYINTPVRISENVLIIIYTDTVLIIFYSYLFSAYKLYTYTYIYTSVWVALQWIVPIYSHITLIKFTVRQVSFTYNVIGIHQILCFMLVLFLVFDQVSTTSPSSLLLFENENLICIPIETYIIVKLYFIIIINNI